MQSEFCIKNMNLFEDNDRSEQPTVNIVGKRYVPVPLSYRETLQSIGFKQGKNAHEWIKDYRGYTIVSRERTNRLKVDILIRKGKETLLAETAYTEKQIINTVKQFEQKIDKFKKDPYDRSEESIFDQMNNIDDEKSLLKEAIVDGQMIEIAYHSDWDITDLVGEKQTLKKYGIEVTLQGSVPDSYGTHRLCIKGTAKQLLTYAEETEDEQLIDALEEQILDL